MTADTSMYQRPRHPRDEARLQQLASELEARGVVAPDAPAASQEPAPGPASPAGQPAAGQGQALISRVHPHPDNIREVLGDLEETTASIRAHGILQPLLVEPMPDMPGHWRVIGGHRRLAAGKAAGLQAVPITVREPDGTPPEELMLIENCHREGVTSIDKAEAMGKLRNRGYSVARIAKRTGFAEPTIYTYLALLDLDGKTRQMVRDGRLTVTDALAGVRRVRKQRRRRAGRPEVGPLWEPDHFTGQHQLARLARKLCDARQHTARRRVGKVACGQCWETVIREDERTVKATLGGGQ
ncbi:MAG TPA: ParB/RepB/Spo0J family partition protein [Trebonia sp.]|jgi:ParB family chromosome partitioning protein|nr:ParB/RepB/Spo0J family partition protein [Trebonia sp.]